MAFYRLIGSSGNYLLGSEVEFVDSFCGDKFGTTGAFSELLMRFSDRLVAELLKY